MSAEDRAALRAKVAERWNGWGLHPANLMPVGTLADQIDLLDAADERDRLVAEIEALAELGVRENWTPDEFRAGLLFLLTREQEDER